MSDNISDADIVRLYLERNETASELSIKRYNSRIYRFAVTLLSDKRDVEECVNDTFLKAWNTIPPQQPTDLFSYLARLCRCTAYDIMKKYNAAKRSVQIVELTKEMEECIPDKLSETELSDEKLATLLNDFLETLSQDNRVIFIRHYWFGESLHEIAEKFDFSESKVKTSLHRTRVKLKEYLYKKGFII